jgi:hypothetical protein
MPTKNKKTVGIDVVFCFGSCLFAYISNYMNKDNFLRFIITIWDRLLTVQLSKDILTVTAKKSFAATSATGR